METLTGYAYYSLAGKLIRRPTIRGIIAVIRRNKNMPFKSKVQQRAAFSGALGPKMKAAAPEWASKTNEKRLPERVTKKGKK